MRRRDAWVLAGLLFAGWPSTGVARDVVPEPLRLVVDEEVPVELRVAWRAAGARVVVRPTRSTSHRAPYLARLLRSADEVELALPLTEAVVVAVRSLDPGNCSVSLVGATFGPGDRVAVDRLGPCRLRLTLTTWDPASAGRWPATRGPLRWLLDALPPAGALASQADRRGLLVVPAGEVGVASGAIGRGALRVGAGVSGPTLDSAILDGLEAQTDSLAAVVVHGPPTEAFARRLRALPGEHEWRLEGRLAPAVRRRVAGWIQADVPGVPRRPDDDELDAPLRRLPPP